MPYRRCVSGISPILAILLVAGGNLVKNCLSAMAAEKKRFLVNQSSFRDLDYFLHTSLPVPYRAEEMLTSVSTVDGGPVAELTTNLGLPGDLGRAAASVVGATTVTRMLDLFETLANRIIQAQPADRASISEEYDVLQRRIGSATLATTCISDHVAVHKYPIKN